MKHETERIRIKYLYRSLVLKGKIAPRPDVARKILGPDCAYHLYTLVGCGDGKGDRARKQGSRSTAGGRGR